MRRRAGTRGRGEGRPRRAGLGTSGRIPAGRSGRHGRQGLPGRTRLHITTIICISKIISYNYTDTYIYTGLASTKASERVGGAVIIGHAVVRDGGPGGAGLLVATRKVTVGMQRLGCAWSVRAASTFEHVKLDSEVCHGLLVPQQALLGFAYNVVKIIWTPDVLGG